VFGGASGNFDGINDSVTTPANSQFDPNAEDFTVECRLRLTNNADATYAVMSQQQSGTAAGWLFFVLGASHRISFASGPQASKIYTATSGGLTVNTWTAVAASKQGDTLRLYQDGTLVGSFTYVDGSISLSDQSVLVGFGFGSSGTIWNAGEQRWWQGQIDELRYVTGTALYTGSSYDLATSAFPPP
jgi:Concanavalin A-like lectin/glucanases superfamily